MSSNHRWDVDQSMHLIASAHLSITDATTSYFDFGTPDNINLAAITSAYQAGDRIAVVITTDSDGSTDTITAVIQDADDSSGSIGTPATAVTSGTLLMGAGDKQAVFGVKVQPGRPWLKIGVTESGATDTISCVCTVFGVRSGA